MTLFFLGILIHMCVCVCVCLFTFEVSFKRLFAPTFRNWVLKIFRDSESLGKSNGKEGFQIGKLLVIKGVKSPRKKNQFFGEFCLIEQNFFGIGVSHSV